MEESQQKQDETTEFRSEGNAEQPIITDDTVQQEELIEKELSKHTESHQQQDESKKTEQEVPPTPSRREKGLSVSVDQETFVPPTSKRAPSGSVAVRPSIAPGGRRFSNSEKNLSRKSKFGGLSSRARMVLGSIVDIKTNAADFYDKKTARYQNTFKLESDKPFNPEKVDRILREVMNEAIENLHYDPDKCAGIAKQASMLIRSRVKQLDFDRYKLICVVSIGEKNSQDVYATCRFLWDAEKDRYSFYSLENSHVYAIAYCFGLYYE